jgi:hypothetical protein
MSESAWILGTRVPVCLCLQRSLAHIPAQEALWSPHSSRWVPVWLQQLVLRLQRLFSWYHHHSADSDPGPMEQRPALSAVERLARILDHRNKMHGHVEATRERLAEKWRAGTFWSPLARTSS